MLVSFHAVFVHANVRFDFGRLERLIGTPRSHHWHHATALVDTNFAIHVPALDRLFGTQHLPPGGWPERGGIQLIPCPHPIRSSSCFRSVSAPV